MWRSVVDTFAEVFHNFSPSLTWKTRLPNIFWSSVEGHTSALGFAHLLFDRLALCRNVYRSLSLHFLVLNPCLRLPKLLPNFMRIQFLFGSSWFDFICLMLKTPMFVLRELKVLSHQNKIQYNIPITLIIAWDLQKIWSKAWDIEIVSPSNPRQKLHWKTWDIERNWEIWS